MSKDKKLKSSSMSSSSSSMSSSDLENASGGSALPVREMKQPERWQIPIRPSVVPWARDNTVKPRDDKR